MENSKASFTKYNPDYKERDRSLLSVNDKGQLEIAAPELSDILRAETAKGANLEESLKNLPIISVDSVTLWAAHRRKVLSSNTVLAFLLKAVDRGDLIELHDERGNQYFQRTDAYNRLHPISRVNRDALAQSKALASKGYTD